MLVESSIMDFEVDTGSALTIISEKTYRERFHGKKLETTNIIVKTYFKERVNVLGTIDVNVAYKEEIVPGLKLHVIQGAGVNLLGRNWLKYIKLDWKNIFQSYTRYNNNILHDSTSIGDQLQMLISKHDAIFPNELGTIKGLKAKLHVKVDSTPKFCKARNVPFAMKEAVGNEINRLEDEGILKSVSFSDWASAIVIVLKPDGSIRICGDYKNTVNPIIENEVYPIPTPDELFAKMDGGTKFSKIDLSQAYLQVQLDDESKKYTVINTSKGLKEYTRMPYGIKPATGIFQLYIENALRAHIKRLKRTKSIV